MKQLLKLGLAALLALGLLAGVASPASANRGVAVFTGNASTTALGLPTSTPPTSASWNIVTTACLVTVDESLAPGTDCGFNGGGSLSPAFSTVTGGPGIGPSCGASSGTGAGTITIDGEAHDGGVFWYSSVGSVFPVFSTASATSTTPDGRAVSLVQVRPSTPTDCLGGATSFTFVAVAAGLSH